MFFIYFGAFCTYFFKNTDESHDDHKDLVKALKCMQDVASYINEIKRRHELSMDIYGSIKFQSSKRSTMQSNVQSKIKIG